VSSRRSTPRPAPDAAEHPVLDVLRERHRAGSRPGAREDPHRVALVLEGGGMRGVVSSAMTVALEEAGLTDALDLVVGTSAGALNGAALVSGVAAGCCAEYTGAFVGRDFINPARLLLGRPVFDVGRTLDFSSGHLDAERHRRTVDSPIALHCVATDVDAARSEDLTGLHTLADLRAALLATSRLPLIGGAPVPFRGRRWIDGGLLDPVPVGAALAAGATHVLALLTRPESAAPPPTGGSLTDRLVERHLRRLNPRLVAAYRARPAAYAGVTEQIIAASRDPAAGGPAVLGIWLAAGTPVPSRLERDPAVLGVAAAVARERAAGVLASAVA
jgi:predicted patatin/cPLA2 family phospholipase